MTVSAGNAAIVVVEMQNDLVAPALCDQRGLSGALARAVRDRRVVENLAGLLSRARAAGLPILYACKERHPSIPQPSNAPIYARAAAAPILLTGTPGAGVVEELKPQEGDVVVRRFTGVDPSHGSELWSILTRLRVDTLVVAGVSTTLAVEGLVRAAANRGFRVVVAEDCCASVPQEWHDFSATNVLPLLATVTQAAELQLA